MTDELSLSNAMDATLAETMANINAREAHEPTDTGRERDESGRFAARKPAEPAQEAAVEDQPEDHAVAEQQSQPPAEAKPAPGSWPKELKDKFGSIEQSVQEYLHKREADISRTINQYSQKAKLADSYTQAIQPYEGILRADGVDPVQAVAALMQTYQVMTRSSPAQKAEAFREMAERFGVDISSLSGDGGQPATRADDGLYAKVAALEAELANRRAAEQNAEQASVASMIADFQTKAPHFEAVRLHMGALLQSGLAKDMQDAYEQACMAHPEIRATVLGEQEAKRREEAQRAAAAARKAAAVNVSTRGAQPSGKPTGSMEDTMRARYRELHGG